MDSEVLEQSRQQSFLWEGKEGQERESRKGGRGGVNRKEKWKSAGKDRVSKSQRNNEERIPDESCMVWRTNPTYFHQSRRRGIKTGVSCCQGETVDFAILRGI